VTPLSSVKRSVVNSEDDFLAFKASPVDMDSCFSTNCSLNEDVLLEVFEHLDYEELVQCEAVCRQWREILLCGSVWKQWFQKQVALSPPWQETWKKRAIDDNALETADYRAICRETTCLLRSKALAGFR